jgi:PKHD-type hydroxylase
MSISPHAQNNRCLSDKLAYTVDPQLEPEMISAILTSVRKKHPYPGRINIGDGTTDVVSDVRKSKIHILPLDHWIAGILHNLFISANNDYFHYDLDHFDSGIQTSYYTTGDHYTWHSDGLADTTPRGYERKLSMSFLLTDDYKGGELELEFKPNKYSYKPKAGSTVIFPSWMPHRVKPVKSGERISLVAWMNGPKFK